MTILNADWDVFISHAWEDKEPFVRSLAKSLESKGIRVWYDEFTLKVGDSLRRSIEYGLSKSRYGIVILSPKFFSKEWPQKELDGLVAREATSDKVILPVWHNIDARELRQYSPILADRVAVSSSMGLEHVTSELLRVVRPVALPKEISIQSDGDILQFSDLTMDRIAHEVRRGDRVINLTRIEFQLLEFLMSNPGRLLKHQDIYEQIWGWDFGGESNSLQVYVRYLRKKLGEPDLIQTVRGFGYKLRSSEG